MKTLILAGMAMSVSAFAALPANVTTFRCVTDSVIEGKAPTTLEFMVENLGQKAATYYTVDPDSWEPVQMNPQDSVLMLNENWTFAQKSDRLHATSDGDGCQWTDLELFQNSGYTRGYVRVTDGGGCGAKSVFSLVRCSVK